MSDHIFNGIYHDQTRSDDRIMRFPCQQGNGGTIDDEGFWAGWTMCNLWHNAKAARIDGLAGFRWYTPPNLFEQAVEVGRYAGYEMTVPPDWSPEWNETHTMVWVEFGHAPRPAGSPIWHD